MAEIVQQAGFENLPPKHPDKAEHADDWVLLLSDSNLEIFLFFCARFIKLTIPVTVFCGSPSRV